MPIMYNKTFQTPRFILFSQWFTMDGYGRTVYKSINPRGLGSVRRGRPYTAILFSGIQYNTRDWVVTNVHAPHRMTRNEIIKGMEAGALGNYIEEIRRGEVSVAVVGDFNTGHKPGSIANLMGLQSVHDYQARGASCCWDLQTRNTNNRRMNSVDGTSMYDQVWIFDGRGHWNVPRRIQTLDWADEPMIAFSSDHRPVEAYISAR